MRPRTVACGLLMLMMVAGSIFAQTPERSGAPLASPPPPAVAEERPLLDYIDLLQRETQQHREWMETYYKWVFGVFTVTAALLGAGLGFLTKDKLDTIAKRVEQRFDSAVKNQVNAQVQQITQQLNRVQQQYENALKITNKLDEGRNFYTRKMFDLAAASFEKVLELDPQHDLGRINLATCYSYFTPPRYDDAQKILDEVIDELRAAARNGLDKKPLLGLGLYNRACIRYLSGTKQLDAQVLRDLEAAFAIDKNFRETASTDEDWAGVRNDPRFQRLFPAPVAGAGTTTA